MATLAAPPDVLYWAPRSAGHSDCAVAALEIACGVSYEHALTSALSVAPDVLVKGMTWPEIRRAAKNLGCVTRLVRNFDLDEDTGILDVWQPHVKDSAHVVYLWEGRIIEPANGRQQLWLQASSFISHYHYKHGSLLVLGRDE